MSIIWNSNRQSATGDVNKDASILLSVGLEKIKTMRILIRIAVLVMILSIHAVTYSSKPELFAKAVSDYYNHLVGKHKVKLISEDRKMYWEEQQKYYCVGVIERIITDEGAKISHLFTFNEDDLLRKQLLSYTPSYYIAAIIPDYYENLINETLKLFNITTVYPNVRTIKLSQQDKHMIYVEEYLIENSSKKSYGCILIPENEFTDNNNNLSFYKRNLRFILDEHKNPIEIIHSLNPRISDEKWCTSSDEDLNKIRSCLDIID